MNEKDLVLQITVDVQDRYKFISPTGTVESSVLMNVQQLIGNMLRSAPVTLPDSRPSTAVPSPANVQE